MAENVLDAAKRALADYPVEVQALREMEHDPMGLFGAIKEMALEMGMRDEYVRDQQVKAGGTGFEHNSERWASQRVTAPHYPALRALLATWHAAGVRREQHTGENTA